MKWSCLAICLAVIALPGSRAGASDTAPKLSANPFERPAWLSDNDAVPVNDQSARQNLPLQLRATLTSGEYALANVGGKIIAVGSEVGGYKLISIADGMAVFEKDSKVIHVNVIRDDKDQDVEQE